ncbi:MAG: iron ABC transporter substrate-binding protein [Treponema sp. GWB1_62_6]|nr:MAG: iron ABC transporter substrate-binding protein [Treponema sp. GWA1_62_8]OHE67358.1 MAG: iron ABC transporter substrate-binding protein [Treponema sp. GWB1_62_6]OHE67505.1 MAG: iron ABC transporter substrate-binding protein [Treponema sp. GWC1_61_84]OHE75136.1 MAG: iron ABC transporter substrate-binding protein [Treponema sp. RIFOXYC1_FULL_61_9]HCM26070.1 iron ABC transporter substrate-binding protein [Treponema sp.]
MRRLIVPLSLIAMLAAPMMQIPLAAQTESKTLVVYTALPDSELPTYFGEFQKDTGIKIQYVRLSAGEVLARIKAEKGNPQASVWYGGSYDNFVAAAKDGLLETYQSPELVNIPKDFHDASGFANPFYVGAISFACNTEWFKRKGLPYPTSWDDLLKPEFKEQISMAHPGTSGTSYTILATIVQMRGEAGAWEYFRALNQNVRQYTKSGAAPPMDVGLGEAAIGITFSHDGLKPAFEGYPVALSFPKDGTGFEIGCVALIKGGAAKELANAKRFIDWTLSKRGQELFEPSKSFRLPVNRLAKAPGGAVDMNDLKVINYNAVWAGENRKRLVEEFTKTIAAQNNLK